MLVRDLQSVKALNPIDVKDAEIFTLVNPDPLKQSEPKPETVSGIVTPVIVVLFWKTLAPTVVTL